MDSSSYQTLVKKLSLVPSQFQLINHLLVDVALVTLIYLVFSYSPILANLFLPILMFRSFALMHECVHGSAIRNKPINSIIGIVAGALCALPFEPWKKIHLAHHKWSGNVDKDPSMGLIRNFPSYNRFTKLVLRISWRLWIPSTALAQHFVFWASSWRFVKGTKTRKELLMNLSSIAVPLALYLQLPWLSLAPGILAYLLMVEVINFPHHLQMPMIEGESTFKAKDQHLTARSCWYPKWFSRHILNNFNLHIEHHLFPALPWYRLDEIKVNLKEQLGNEYQNAENNSWIVTARSKPIDEILAYTELTSIETIEKRISA
jgi:acyl-lipid omega-6 desaturase (Delta-12 desaturase)